MARGGRDLLGEAAAAPPEEKHYHGHRQRLRARFLDHGADSFADYELLELLLFMAVPRRDIRPLAKQLIDQFGDFAGVCTAPPERLMQVAGISEAAAAAIKTVQASAIRLSRQQARQGPVISNWQGLLDYCHTAMAHQPVEQFRVLFLDKKNRIIADEVQGQGTVDQTPAYPREVMKRALELGATALVLVHNHPSGDPTPSKADIALTKDIVQAARPFDIVIHDHLIIARSGHESLKALGVM